MTTIETDADYQTALAEAERLVAVDPPIDSEDGRRLMKLVPLIEDYESKHYPIE